MTYRHLITTALAIAGAVAVCGAAEIPVVHNAAPAEADTARYDLEELWRQGGPDGDVLIGWIASVVADDAGRVYLLDSRLNHIQVLDADGAPTATLGREGEGPGEFPNPFGLCWWEEDVLCVAGGRLGALDLIDTAGDPVDTLILSDAEGERLMQGVYRCVRLGDGVVVASNMGTSSGGMFRSEHVVVLHGPDGAFRTTLFEHVVEKPMRPHRYDEAADASPWSGYAVLDGRFYAAAERNRYEIEVHDADGEPVLRFGRDHVSRVRTEDELAERRDGYLERVREFFPDAEAEFLPVDRDVHSVVAAADGTLWVKHARSIPEEREDLLRVYDVFDVEGRWLRRAALLDPHPGASDDILYLPDDRMLRQVLIDEDGGIRPEDTDVAAERGLVCYRLIRRD